MSPASGASGRRVTIRSMSCRGVKAFVPFQKPPLYAAVSLGGRREKTPPDTTGGENPDWEGTVVNFDVDGDGQQLVQFEVKAQVPLLGTKLVGTASVPVADLEAGDSAARRYVSYQVCAPDGKPNGTLSFAYVINGGARPPPQLSSAADGAPPVQSPTFSCVPTPPPSAVTAYPPPSPANFSPHGGGYPPLASPSADSAPVLGSLYPQLQDLLPSSPTYPPPPSTLPHPATVTNPHFPEPNSSSYPPPRPTLDSIYPRPQDPWTAGPAVPPAHHISTYPPAPPPPMSSYPPPPPSGYPPPLSNLPSPTTTYPPLLPESGSVYPVPPRSVPSPSSSRVDRELQYYPAPPGGSYYPPPESHHPDVDGTARMSYYYPPPGSRYP